MPRVKRGTVRRAKRKKLEKLTKGYFQNKSKLYKFMKEAAEKAGVYAYAGRKQKKRDYRSLWVMRVHWRRGYTVLERPESEMSDR